MIDLPGIDLDPQAPQDAPHTPTARRKGRRALHGWTAVGILGVAGLTALTAGLAFEQTSSQEAARHAVVTQAQAAYNRRLAAEDANLAAVRQRSRQLARTLAREHALLAARQAARAAAAAAAARVRVASGTTVYAAVTGSHRSSTPHTTTTPHVTRTPVSTPVTTPVTPTPTGGGQQSEPNDN